MRIANGVEMLEIAANMMGKQSIICPTLLWDEQSAVLVDTGYPGQLPLIRQALEQAGISFETLSKVILTHQDLDHIGSLPNILTDSAQKIEVLANEIEKPFIQGEKRLLKITDEAIAQIDANFPPDVPEEWRKAFKQLLENPPHAQVDTIVVDGAELPDCGGITIIDTPGHTPGHISLYHQPSKTLIAGDAMVVRDGQLFGPDPQYTLDLDEAMRSLKKLTRYDIETVICYHGGSFSDQVNSRIAELVAGH